MRNRTVFTVLLLAAAFALPQSATSQLRYSNRDAVWWTNMCEQHRQSLNSSNRRIVVLTMKQMARFAKEYPDQVDYSKSLPQLVRMYYAGGTPQMRRTALATLRATGNEHLTVGVAADTARTAAAGSR